MPVGVMGIRNSSSRVPVLAGFRPYRCSMERENAERNGQSTEHEAWLPKRRIAEFYGYSVRWVERQVANGMPCRRIGGQLRFQLTPVDAWIRRRALGEDWHAPPCSKEVVNSKTARCRAVYYGSFRHRGKQYWVPGTRETTKASERAADEIKARAEREREEARRFERDASNSRLAKVAGATAVPPTGRCASVDRCVSAESSVGGASTP